MAKKPLEIDMCAGSQLRDTQGEMLSVEGADIDDLVRGNGRINDNHGKGFFNSIGRVVTAKKIFKDSDCEDDRHKYYWDKVKAPYIYVKAVLYDDEDHPNAKAAAAILRNIHKSDVPLKLKASVEGGVISRGISDPSLLSKTKIHSIALTFTPANNATLVEPLSLDKSHDQESDMTLIRSVMHLAQSNVPSFRHIVRDASASKIQSNVEKIIKYIDADKHHLIPSKKEIIESAISNKIENNICKIHDIIKDHNLDKGLKEAAIAGMIGAASMAPMSSQDINSNKPSSKIEIKKDRNKLQNMHVSRFIKDSQKDPLLHAIGHVESTGGKFFDKHKTVDSPGNMNHGMTAAGTYAIMPLTAETIFRSSKKLSEKYPEFNNLLKNVKNNHVKITNSINENPNLSTDLARAGINLNRHILKRNGIEPSEDALLYAHNHGVNKAIKTLKESPASVSNDEYVVKAKNLRQINRLPAYSINKALTAGYGGATSPTSRFGGSVLQTEALNNGRSGLKYATCDHCGKEQVYSKFQVKCRECGKNWSLSKIHKIISDSKGTI
jgi:hypothetical protein